MSRVLPFPFVSAFLLAMWLLLNQTLSLGHLLLGTVLALCGGWMLRVLQSPTGRARNPGAAVRLAVNVLIDIVASNITVAGIIFTARKRQPRSGFMNIPLDLRDRYGLTILACIVTATPGTLWVNFNPASGILMIHVLDLVDEQAWIDTIKGRYERLLREIFE